MVERYRRAKVGRVVVPGDNQQQVAKSSPRPPGRQRVSKYGFTPSNSPDVKGSRAVFAVSKRPSPQARRNGGVGMPVFYLPPLEEGEE